MPVVSAKRQITLPVEQCRELGLEPGDEIETFVHDGHITIVKKRRGAAAGKLKHLRHRTRDSDHESMMDSIRSRRSRSK